MQWSAKHSSDMHSLLAKNQFLVLNFLFRIPLIRTLCTYVKKDVRIGGFSKPKGVRNQNNIGKKQGLTRLWTCRRQTSEWMNEWIEVVLLSTPEVAVECVAFLISMEVRFSFLGLESRYSDREKLRKTSISTGMYANNGSFLQHSF